MTADGFFKSGDIGFMDERGHTRIVDRKKDMIIVSGFNVYPNEIESVVTEHPGVLECAPSACRTSARGSGQAVRRPQGSVADRGGPDGVLPATVHRLQEAEGHRVPGQLPKSNVGKILRRELREAAPAEAARTA